MSQELTFTIPTPASAKNSRRLVRVGGRTMSIKSAAAMASYEQTRRAVTVAMRGQSIPMLIDQDVEVVMIHHVESETVTVTVRYCGPAPHRGRRSGRRRDISNLPDVVLDAMQGIIFSNDNQVARLFVSRDATMKAKR